jgi:hypothetical protein
MYDNVVLYESAPEVKQRKKNGVLGVQMDGANALFRLRSLRRSYSDVCPKKDVDVASTHMVKKGGLLVEGSVSTSRTVHKKSFGRHRI